MIAVSKDKSKLEEKKDNLLEIIASYYRALIDFNKECEKKLLAFCEQQRPAIIVHSRDLFEEKLDESALKKLQDNKITEMLVLLKQLKPVCFYNYVNKFFNQELLTDSLTFPPSIDEPEYESLYDFFIEEVEEI
jgi:hypothetical protein